MLAIEQHEASDRGEHEQGDRQAGDAGDERGERAEARDLRHQHARRGDARRRRRARSRATWEENVRLAQHADRIGIDAIVPVARWRGYGGARNLGERSFETFTWAAGLLALTRAHPGLRDLPRAARPSRAGGEDGGDRRSHLRRALRAQHRLRLEPAGAGDVRHHASASTTSATWSPTSGRRCCEQLWTVPGESRLRRHLLPGRARLLGPQAGAGALPGDHERRHEPRRPRVRRASTAT